MWLYNILNIYCKQLLATLLILYSSKTISDSIIAEGPLIYTTITLFSSNS